MAASHRPLSPSRVAGYVRLSRAEDDSTSVARQREIIASTAAARGWQLVEVVEDVDVSASKKRLDRPGLDRVRELVRSGAVDLVLVWRLDRLARSVVDFGTLLDEGLQVASCTEPLDTSSPMGRAMAEILQVFAALESSTTGERVSSAIEYRVAQGDRWRGGATPYGYRSVKHPSGDGKTLVVDPDEAAFVRRAAEIVLGGGSLYRAMRELNEAGSTPRKADSWSISSLKVVLTGDAVLGRQTRHGAVMRGEDGLVVAAWPPILAVEESERLRAALVSKGTTMVRTKAARLLSGLVVCSSCERKLRVNSRKGSGGAQVETYGCRSHADGKPCKAPVTINAVQLEELVVGEYLAIAGGLRVVERIERRRDAAELAAVEEAIAHTTTALRDPAADVPVLVERLVELRARRDALAAADEVTVDFVETGELTRDAFEAGDLDRKRELIASALVGAIEVEPVGRGRRVAAASRCAVPWAWTEGW